MVNGMRSSALLSSCAVICFSILTAPLSAQPRPSTADSLVSRGNLEYMRSSLDSAYEDFKEALVREPSNLAALLGAGKSLAGSGTWSKAAGYFEDAIVTDSASEAAHYFLAICNRETGKAKAWLFRDADWRASRDNFRWVIARDSLFEDVLYQYALLLNCDKDYTGAIQAGIAQVRIRPHIDIARLGLFKLYRSFVVNDGKSAISWLAPQLGSEQKFFLAEGYRRAKNIAGAEHILDSLVRTYGGEFITACYLSLARCAAMQEKPDLAEKYFWDAVESIREPLDADFVFEDIKYLVSDAELQLYRTLSGAQQKSDFIRGFWTARNPSPGTNSNPRIGEHYRRLVFAEENYEYYGFRTQFTNPDRLGQLTFPRSFFLNQEFNDMGEIYIRHGAPTSILRADMGSGDPNQSWLYEQTGDSPRMIFHFIRKNTIQDNWRLAPLPENRALLADLATWDPEYLDLLRDDAAQVRIADKVLNESRAAVTTALTTEAHSRAEGVQAFDVPHSIDTFRGKGTKALVDISYALPLSIIRSGLAGEEQSLRVVVGLELHSLEKETGFSRLDTIQFTASRSMEGSYIGLYRFYLPADRYSFSMQVRPLGTRFVGNWSSTDGIPDYSGSDFDLSDLEFLVPSGEKTAIEIDGIKVSPSPFGIFLRDQPLYLYLRMYNLVKDAEGNTRYTAKYLLVPSKSGFTSGEAEAQIPPDALELAASDKTGQEESAAEFQKIRLNDVDPGMYTLRAVITDRKRVQTIVRSRTIEVKNP